MDALALLKEYGFVINFILVWFVVPIFVQIRNSTKQVEENSKEIVFLRKEMKAYQEQHDRIENAILHITNEKDMKKVFHILKGHSNE